MRKVVITMNEFCGPHCKFQKPDSIAIDVNLIFKVMEAWIHKYEKPKNHNLKRIMTHMPIINIPNLILTKIHKCQKAYRIE